MLFIRSLPEGLRVLHVSTKRVCMFSQHVLYLVILTLIYNELDKFNSGDFIPLNCTNLKFVNSYFRQQSPVVHITLEDEEQED